MKIRVGFVSNSSSSSFVVSIPEDFVATVGDLEQLDMGFLIEELDEAEIAIYGEDWKDGEPIPQVAADEINKTLDNIRSGEIIYQDHPLWYTLVDLLEKQNFVVVIGEGAGDGEGWIERFVDMRKKKGGKK